MKVEVKFDCGDRVYFLRNNKIVKETIRKVIVEVSKNEEPKVSYYFDNEEPIGENIKLFKSKEELKKSL